MALIAAATLVSEDLACLGAGTLVARGAIGLLPATSACFFGIVGGDLLLFLAGRCLGRKALALPPLKWVLPAERVRAASQWVTRRGAIVVLLSRFLPGTRLPVYFAAGMLGTSLPVFAFWFVAAALLWTPLLVGASMHFGSQALMPLFGRGALGIVASLFMLATFVIAWRAAVLASSHHGRRLFVSSWIRIRRWEYWSPWIFYPPVVLYVVWLGVKHRGLTLFSAANPAMPAGGFIAESKAAILEALQEAGAPVARFRRIPAGEPPDARIALARAFMLEVGLGYPLVLKPDVGQRGCGVAVITSDAELELQLREAKVDLLVQEFIPGPELGVFYVRFPEQEHGFLFSLTEKILPSVTGDGERTLERLILDDPERLGMLRFHLGRLVEPYRIPALGERVALGAVGNHCRGALFHDGAWLETPALLEAVDRMSRHYAGFHFGRYDLRAPSLAAFRAGRDIRILELNGVTSEATDIYDPKNSLASAYRKLFRQWRLAFEIGQANRSRGAAPARLSHLLRLLLRREGSDARREASPRHGASVLPA